MNFLLIIVMTFTWGGRYGGISQTVTPIVTKEACEVAGTLAKNKLTAGETTVTYLCVPAR